MAKKKDDGIEYCYAKLGQRIRSVRLKAGLTQLELAQRMTLTRSSITNIETGRQRVLLHQVKEIADALYREPKDILKGIWA